MSPPRRRSLERGYERQMNEEGGWEVFVDSASMQSVATFRTEENLSEMNHEFQNQSATSSKKRKGSEEKKTSNESRKRSRGSSLQDDSDETPTRGTSGENASSDGKAERFSSSALMARTWEQTSRQPTANEIIPALPTNQSLVPPAPHPTPFIGTTQHNSHFLQHYPQLQSAMGSWSQLSPLMQSALLSSAAATVGPVFPGQPQNLASILAFQEATRLAAAGQFIAANPLAQQLLLQQFMGLAATGHPAAPPTMPLVAPNYNAIFSPWPGLPSAAAVGLPPFALQSSNVQSIPSAQTTSYPRSQAEIGGAEATARPPEQIYTAESIGPDVPDSLPAILALPDDESKLSAYQLLLRNQIEAFSATMDDLSTHARGRNKPITLRQVGIRCRHCSHLALNRRKKGSAYFPFSLLGLYQAAQNMGSSHYHGESCSDMSDELKAKFVESIACKSTVGSGKLYWAQSARRLGLVDTENGIRFIRDLVAMVST